MANEDLPKIRDTAKRLRIARGTVGSYAGKGLIPVVKLPSGLRRFRPSDVEELGDKMGFIGVEDEGKH